MGDVLAELVYEKPGFFWRAVVEKTHDEFGDAFLLLLQRGAAAATAGNLTQAGKFANSKALVKYLRDKVAGSPEFKGAIPVKDTLVDLLGRNASSVVPACYTKQTGGGKGKTQCLTCPWAADCGDSDAKLLVNILGSPEPEAVTQPAPEPAPEPDALSSLIKSKWGDWNPDE